MTKVIGGDDQGQWWADRLSRYLGLSQTLYTRSSTSSHLMQLFIDADQLRIELTRMERFWAVHVSKTISIPLAQIRQVTTDVPTTNWQEIRSPGTSVPGWIKAGTYYHDRLRSFWYTQPKKPVLTLELAPNAYYRKIVLAIDDNSSWRDRIQAACGV
jgi:hypothetical protein